MALSKDVVDRQISNVGPFHKWFVGKEIGYLPSILREGEEIAFLTSGYVDGNTVLAVATNFRLMVLDAGLVYGLRQQEFPYDKVNSVTGVRGIFFGKVKISTAGVSGYDVIINWVRKRDIPKLVAAISRFTSKKD
ncbi:MAG: PH domain-containing protein [Pyramidobacter sp.]|nr:PH domain-containing protein [Pyramidobacter sp.]